MIEKGIDYCRECAKKGSKAPRYVRKQCKKILPIFDGKDKNYMLDEVKMKKIEQICTVLKMPKGLSAGQPIANCLAGFQWLLIIASLCVVRREEYKRRKYTNIILEIARKNGKTFIIGLIFILLFFTEPMYSKFFSVAPDGSLSRLIKGEIVEIINYNGVIFETDSKNAMFKIRRDDILYRPNEILFTPLNYSNSRLDGKLPSVFICDEVGALPNSYAFEAMRSGQITTLNKLGFLISTKYPNASNPFEDEVEMCKKILDGAFDDEETFALLYEPDDTKNWQTDDLILQQANPLALDVDEIMEDLKKKRARAIESEAARENFLCKHCNIIYQGAGTESFVPIENVKECKSEISFDGLKVYVGVDLAMTNDNCSVSIVAVDEGKILCDVYAFVPEGRIAEKSSFEHIDYVRFIDSGKCIPCGDMTVDYGVIEDFVFNIEDRFNCQIVAIGYDRYNCLSSAQKWSERFECVEIRQHSDTLHPPTKMLYEKILNHEFAYAPNKLLEINFENARCTYDTNMNRYVTKKKSNGKVDMVVSTINAVYLAQQDALFDMAFVVQVV